MGIDFYYMPISAPSRGVLLAAKAYGVQMDCKLLNLLAGEHMKPEFLAVST
jgi:glutathione S-transferase